MGRLNSLINIFLLKNIKMLGVNWATAVNRGLSLKGSGTSWQQKNIFRENHSKKKFRETQKFNFYFRAFLLILGSFAFAGRLGPNL